MGRCKYSLFLFPFLRSWCFFSTWTIDLVYLLHRYGVQQQYCTITPGIDPGYHRQSFYGYGKVLRMVSTNTTGY